MLYGKIGADSVLNVNKNLYCYLRLAITVTRYQSNRECLSFNISQNIKKTINVNKRFISATLTYLEVASYGIC